MKRLCCSTGPCSSRHVLTEEETDAITRRVEISRKFEIRRVMFHKRVFHVLKGENKEYKTNTRTLLFECFLKTTDY